MKQEASAQQGNILEVRNVTKRFGDSTALHDVTLHVKEGEFLTLLGPSGCGKTTLIRIIAGFETPTSGDVCIDGKSIIQAPAYRRPLGMVFQNLALFPHMTVAQNIGYGLRIRRTPRDEIDRIVNDALAMVGLDQFGQRYIGQISGGQKQRVALARAIVTRPRVLLLDEPFGALDMKIRKQMQTELKQIQESIGTTFIFVTHDQEEALTMSDRIAVFRNGMIDQLDDPMTIYERPATRFVAEFVGDTNFLEGRIVQAPGAAPHFVSQALDMDFPLPEGAHAPAGNAGLSIRPQHVRLVGQQDSQLHATVLRQVYAGQAMRLWLQAGPCLFIADCHDHARQTPPAPGDTVGLEWAPAHATLVSL